MPTCRAVGVVWDPKQCESQDLHVLFDLVEEHCPRYTRYDQPLSKAAQHNLVPAPGAIFRESFDSQQRFGPNFPGTRIHPMRGLLFNGLEGVGR